MTGHWNRANKSLATLACLCLLAPVLGAQNPSPSSIEHEFEQAMAAQDKGDLDTAEKLLTDLHRRLPGRFEIDESLGLLYVARERFAEALPLLQAAVRERPASDVAHANLGAALVRLDRNPEALAEFERATRLNPRNGAAQQSLGQLAMAANQPARAATAFAAALALAPGDADTMLNLAAAQFDAGQVAAAAQTLAAFPAADRSAPAQSLLGEIAEKQGAFQEAARHFSNAQQLDPSEPNAWQLGVEFLRHWTFEGAIPQFEAAAAKFPASERMRLGLGAAYFGGGKYDQAVPVFADLLAAHADNALYAEFLGMTCTAVMQQQTQTRCLGLVDYAQAHPRDARVAAYAASALLADAAGDERKLQTAEKLLDAAIAADPKLPDSRFELGLLRQTRGQWPESVAPLEEAVRLKPDYAQAHYRLALAYWRTGRKPEGQAEMDLQKKYSRQQAEDLDHRLRQITTFLVDVRKQN